MSALPPEADIRQRIEHVCFVPGADMANPPRTVGIGKNLKRLLAHSPGYVDRASRMRQWATEPPLQASIMRFSSDRMSLSRAIFPSTCCK